MRATSSIRSASMAMSKRQDGGVTWKSPAAPAAAAATSMPSAPRRCPMSRGATAAPSSRSTRCDRRLTAVLRGSDSGCSATVTGPAMPPASCVIRCVATLERALLDPVVDAALEALAGIGHEAVAPRAAGNRLGQKPGRLERDVARGGGRSNCARRP